MKLKPIINLFATLTTGLALAASVQATEVTTFSHLNIDRVLAPLDNNASTNPLLQPDPANDPDPDGDIPDQTLQFGENQVGRGLKNEFFYGGLGTDLVAPNLGHDILMGGPEHFNPLNRDRAFGSHGHDVFIWQPGDGSDRFEGGRGTDAVMFGLISQDDDGDRILFDDDDDGQGNSNFRVRRDELPGTVLLRKGSHVPLVDVSASPGFCEIIDGHTEVPGIKDVKAELAALDLDHLVRFRLRDGNLAVTVQTKDVEIVVCGGPKTGEVEVIDLRVSPPVKHILDDPTKIDLGQNFIPHFLQKRLEQLLVNSQAEIDAKNTEEGVPGAEVAQGAQD